MYSCIYQDGFTRGLTTVRRSLQRGMVTYHSHVVVKKADFDALQGDLKDFLKTSSESVVAHLLRTCKCSQVSTAGHLGVHILYNARSTK